MWYICGMVLRRLVLLTVLLTVLAACAPIFGQATEHSGANRPAKPLSTSSNISPGTGNLANGSDCNGVPCNEQQRQVIVNIPPPPPVKWLWRDQILWGANIVLVILGYAGILLALSTLKKIERQTSSAEAAASAAVESAHAAFLNAQAIIDSQRPWLLISAEPSLNIENSFNIMATNRGRTPATIIATTEQVKIAIDETHLPRIPEYRKDESGAPLVPIVLLPGESTAIMPFRREDLKGVCESEERFKRVVNWEEKVFIYGKVIYKDLIAPHDNQIHETAWCCWYIHGRQKSGMVIAGPPSYNAHT